MQTAKYTIWNLLINTNGIVNNFYNMINDCFKHNYVFLNGSAQKQEVLLEY